MAITEETVRYIAKLAAIELTDEEVVKTTGQMSEVLDYLDLLSKVDTQNVELTTYVHAATNVLSEDISGKSLPIEKLEAMSPYFQNGYFKVPRIINN